jgi:hypothetical protein
MLFAKLFGSPVWVFGGAVVAFGGWLAVEAAHPTDAPAAERRPDGDGPAPSAPPVEARLCAVHPGAPRAKVERQVADLTPAARDASDLSAGAPERARYRVQLAHFVPHLMRGVTPHTFRPGAYVLTLEYDDAHPGSPLRRAELTPE